MSTTQPLGGSTLLGRVLGPSLDTIIKNVAWRKHPQLISACKSTLDHLQTLTTASPPLSPLEFDSILSPLLLALDTASPTIIGPALAVIFRLFSLNIVHFSSAEEGKSVISQLIDSVCKCAGLGDEVIEFSVLKAILAAIRSPRVSFDAEGLNYVVRACYDVYLGGVNGTNQICAKAVLAQIVLIVFSRVELDSMFVDRFRIVSVSELLEFTDRNLSDGNSVQLVQGLINEVMESNEGVNDEAIDRSFESKSENVVEREVKDGAGKASRLREHGFSLFKNLCKLSMNFSSQDHSDEGVLLRGRILSLELLKVIMDNGGPVWGSNERQVS